MPMKESEEFVETAELRLYVSLHELRCESFVVILCRNKFH